MCFSTKSIIVHMCQYHTYWDERLLSKALAEVGTTGGATLRAPVTNKECINKQKCGAVLSKHKIARKRY